MISTADYKKALEGSTITKVYTDDWGDPAVFAIELSDGRWFEATAGEYYQKYELYESDSIAAKTLKELVELIETGK